MKNQKGSAVLWVIIILVIVIIASGAYWYQSQNSAQRAASTTIETSSLQTTEQPTTASGQAATATTTPLSQNNSAPIPAAFSAAPTSGTAPLTVDFSADQDYGDGTVDFGDGNSGSLLDIAEGTPQTDLYFSHTYPAPGTYTAKIRGSMLINGSTVNYGNSVTVKVSISKTLAIAGYYAHTNNPTDGYILVSQSGNTISLKGYAEYASAMGVIHYGALAATTTINANGIANVDLSPNHDGSCEMTLTFSATSSESSDVKVTQTNSGLFCGFGENVQYFGTYYKQPNVPANLPVIQGA